MPAPIIIEDLSGLSEGIAGAGSAFADAIKYRAHEQRTVKEREKHQTVLQNTLGKLSADASPMQIISAYNQAISQLPPELAKSAFAAYEPLLKQGLKKDADIGILRDLGLMPGIQPTAGASTPTQIGAQPEITETATSPGRNPISKWSEDQLVLAQASGVPGLQKMADAELKRRDLEQKRDLADRDYQSKFAKSITDEESALRKKVRDKKLASVMARDAVESGEVGALSLSNIGRRLGIRELQTAKSAQLAQAAKINLVGNLSDVSARAQNLWMEKVMSEAFALIGQTKEANLTAMELFDAELALNDSYLAASDRIKQEDREKYGHVKWESLEERAHKEIEPLENQVMRKTAFRTRQLYEQEKGEQWVLDNVGKQVPKGTMLTPKMAQAFKYKYAGDTQKAVENAKKLGYTIPTKAEKDQWQ